MNTMNTVLINTAISISKDSLLGRILVSLESLLKTTAPLTWTQDQQPSAWRQTIRHHSIGFARKILNCSKSHTVGWDPRLEKNYLQASQNSCGNSVECLNTNENTYFQNRDIYQFELEQKFWKTSLIRASTKILQCYASKPQRLNNKST